MSAGKFKLGKYEADNTVVYPVRIQPETVIATFNPEPAGAITGAFKAKVSGSRRSYGLHTRLVRLAWTGAVPDGYKEGGTITLPVLTATAYANIVVGQTVTYLGSPAEVIGKSPERVR